MLPDFHVPVVGGLCDFALSRDLTATTFTMRAKSCNGDRKRAFMTQPLSDNLGFVISCVMCFA